MEAQGSKTLREAIRFFFDSDRCREYVVARRWPDGVSCPNFRYLNEQSFRSNNRDQETDGERVSEVVRQITSKRLTYYELTGKTNSGELLN